MAITMDSSEKQTDDFSAEVLQFAEMFSQLPPEAKDAMIEILRLLNNEE